MRWFSTNGRRDWTGALIMLPVVLVLFVVLRLIGPGWSVWVAAFVAAAVGVSLVRTARLRRRP
jgi:hypothetical protein